MTRLLVLRPRPGADATVRRAQALGLDALATPIFTVEAVDWTPPDTASFDAVLMTSANAARFGGEGLSRYHSLPLFAVGVATARAAQDAGFTEVTSGAADGAAIVALAVAQGKRRLLHLVGRDHIALDDPRAAIERRIVYASEAVRALPDHARTSMDDGALVLLHSVRAAQLFGELFDAARLNRSSIMIAGLSPAICAAAGVGWASVAAAPTPDDEALLAIAARLCDQSTENGHPAAS
ncbi:MAG: uroporphyrinogen-III synthase [Sphingomonadaceae bacterium]